MTNTIYAIEFLGNGIGYKAKTEALNLGFH